ncbi:flagellar motor protein MotP [Bacillus marinisedimentorum]|uniref:flagellar motor protein MotP n=1 Tax=Bacillus marinisedimentorum TaxID=1821260 RepID=UPI0007DE8AA2|nr:flagellar motor protein MotP [Bacillus marinisedimentorum]
MKKLDVLTPVGIFIGLSMLLLGIYTHSGLSQLPSFMQASSMVIVLGGIAGGLLINFNVKEIKLTFRIMKEAFRTNESDLGGLIKTFIKLADKARKAGLLSLESELDQIRDPFLKKGILLAVDGADPEMIRDIMNAEIAALEERHRKGRSIIEKAGEYAPAWGMLGTIVGLILMLKNLNDPTALGPNMAIALLTTFYGSLLANLVFNPMASKLENKTGEEVFLKEIVIEGIIGIQSGQNPTFLEEKLSAFLSEEEKEKALMEGTENDFLIGEPAHDS